VSSTSRPAATIANQRGANDASFPPILLPVADGRHREKENTIMDGHVARKGTRWYAVTYHGIDPVTWFCGSIHSSAVTASWKSLTAATASTASAW
jgi:hypothetical protein